MVLHGSLNPVCCQWILSQLLRPVLPEAWKARELESVSEEYVQSPASDFRKNVHDTLRSLMLHMPFPRMKGMTLKQALSYSSSLLHPSRYGDRSRSLKETFSSSSGCTAPDLPLDCGFIFSAMLPRSVKELRHPHSAPRRMFKPRVRAASIIAYEDAAYRQKLAIWRARGGRLLYVQHGGNYGQMKRICAMEFVEYTQHAFATWGWTEYEGSMGRKAGKGNFIPLPYPQLNRLRDAWHGQESQTLIAVGTEMPTVAYQLDSHPTPSQFIQYRDDKQWFSRPLAPRFAKKHCIVRISPYLARSRTRSGSCLASPTCICAPDLLNHRFFPAAFSSSTITVPRFWRPWPPISRPSATGIRSSGRSPANSRISFPE